MLTSARRAHCSWNDIMLDIIIIWSR